MDEPKSDVVNDLSPSSEPSFVHVAICVGTDIDSDPVTLVDRLCLNRSASDKLMDDMKSCYQQMVAFRGEADTCAVELEKSELAFDIAFWVYIAATLVLSFVGAALLVRKN